MTAMTEPLSELQGAEAAVSLLLERGGAMYGGEAVTQLEHALQAAQCAEQAGEADTLVVAALLHDIGHLMHGLGEDCADRGRNDHHEEVGARYLERTFGPAVAEPVRLHVAAKRYLVATDPEYRALLSPASVQSLALQGGAFGRQGILGFERRKFGPEAVRLRRYDEAAKVPGATTAALEHFAAIARSLGA